MSDATRAIFLKIGSTLFFTLMLACVKLVGDRAPPGEIVFFRSAFGMVPLLVMLAVQGRLADAVRTRRPFGHLIRGLAGLAGMTLWFMSVERLPLPEAMAINYGTPLMIVILAALFLKEKVRIFRWSAVFIGLAGIAVILWPRLEVLERGFAGDREMVGAMLALASTVAMATAAVLVRRLTGTESTASIVFYFSLTATLAALMTAPFGWTMPSTGDFILLVSAGLLGGLGQIMVTAAYRFAETSIIAPFDYVSMIWGLTLGYVVFGDVPGFNVWVGSAIVIAAGIFIIFREHQLGLERARMKSVTTPQG
ncbi:DMT family transporter [Afifella pfennigii]|uniref:DMT family transporter n=1 Tax=Afifella pfennigii TaxID=209897 RepID=UPI00047BBDF7|nr:DMT family transporter [Afifella pfennigii]